jgi:hypothetical protein
VTTAATAAMDASVHATRRTVQRRLKKISNMKEFSL